MKIRGEWLVLAQQVIEDRYTQNLSLVSCLEQVAALQFPTVHHGFGVAARYRCVGEPPLKAVKVHYRLQRRCDTDPPEIVGEFDGQWEAGTRWARVVVNFQYLRLKRPEMVTFWMEHRVGGGRWEAGPSSELDVVQLELSLAQREALQAEASRLGLPLALSAKSL